ncbi:TIGR01841 family phasin [Oxalobacteraceae bacterium OTU3REALA1]|nr:TIGR01841 family phasin [Oxalobacteraceae bacterium OTU3REALA1]
MSSLTEQFSAVTKSQLEAQFKIFNTFASTAVDSAEKVIALNLNTTKASVEKSSAAARKLLEAKGPQELFSLNATQPTGFDNLLAYGRQLVSIATAAQTELLQSAQSGIKQAQEQAQELAKASPLAAVVKPLQAVATTPVAKPAPLASVAPVAEPAPTAAAKASEPAAPPPTLAAAVSAAVAVATPDNAPVIAEASTASANEALASPAQKAAKAPVKPKPAAAPIEPPAPVEVKAEVKPDPAKSSFPVPSQKPIALAPETKPSKLKEVAPKGKPAPGKPLDMISGGKGKK